MTLVVSLSGVVAPLPSPSDPASAYANRHRCATGVADVWFACEVDPEPVLVLFIPPLLFADGWKTPTREFLEHGREILASRWWWSPWSALASLFTGWCRAFRWNCRLCAGGGISSTDAVALRDCWRRAHPEKNHGHFAGRSVDE
ncbi:cation:proton antiporter [Escherichia coli]